jgi:hypothetical protein
MEINNEKPEMGQLMPKSQNSLQSISPQTTNNSISIYQDELSIPFAIAQTLRLKKAFPNLPEGFYDILLERVKETGFTDQRLKDAIDTLIDNFIYPNPAIANIISFDKRVKLHSYIEVCDLVVKGNIWDDFSKVKIKGKYFWITKVEKEQFGIKY